MLYYSERNYGCRFLEISIVGYRSIILENEKIRIMLLMDTGTEIIEFNQKATDTDFIWRSPNGLSCLKKINYAKKDGYTRGWFECFPNTGDACKYKGAEIPQYGEICYLPWEYIVLKEDPGEVSLKCFVKTIKTPFLDKNCVIDIQSTKGIVRYSGPNSRFRTEIKGRRSFFRDKKDNEINASLVQKKFSGICKEIDLNNLKKDRIGIVNRQQNTGVEPSRDLEMFKHCTIRNIANGDIGYPGYGDTYVPG